MKIPGNYKQNVLGEFEFVLGKLKEELPLEEKLYFYSALFGIIYRVMNWECTSELVFLHHVLNVVHNSFIARLQAMNRKSEAPVILDEAMVNRLIDLTEALYNRIRSDADSTDICKTLINLSYATTGNGYYLYFQGKLSI